MDKQVFKRVIQQLKEVPNDYKTQAGQNNDTNAENATAHEASDEQINAINQIFELFRFNYHNQFLKAFPDLETLNMAKRLWLKLLSEYSGDVLMRAAERTVKETSWLPTVHQVLSRCELSVTGAIPNAHSAYIEACCATSPKRNYAWRHPIVYHAGRASGWFFLANNPEQIAFPVFERNYHILLERLKKGEELTVTVPKALPEALHQPVSDEEREKILNDLAKSLENH